MVSYMSLEEQVDADFSRARQKALLRRVGTRLRRDNASKRLLCFDDLRKIPRTAGSIDRGMRTVPVSQIGGSVGRCSEFDRDFMPAKASVEERWKRIDRAFHRGEVLPPVSLYKIGSFYFVLDGHHRVSVAAYHGVGWIDAEVREFGAVLPGDRKDEGRPIHHPSSGAGDANVDGRLLVGAAATLAGDGLVVVPGMEDAMASTQSEVSALLESWSEAIRIKDIDRLMSLYSPDIVYFDLVPGLQYTGSAAVRGNFLRMFDGFKGSIGQEIRGLSILASGDIAVAYMLIRASGTLKDGREVGYWVRATVCCQRSDHRWLIAHEHISLPVDFSGSAAMDLVP
jgi:ketosteroid isomerase-like protein